MEQKLAYSPAEVSQLLGISLPSVYMLCRREDFPSIRVSQRRIVIPATSLDLWLDKEAQKG